MLDARLSASRDGRAVRQAHAARPRDCAIACAGTAGRRCRRRVISSAERWRRRSRARSLRGGAARLAGRALRPRRDDRSRCRSRSRGRRRPCASSITAPKMMFAFGSAAFWTISAASLTSNRPRSWPPVMLSRIPVAPSTDSSSSGEEIAALAASAARLSPPAVPMPISAEPASCMIVRTSAKSRLIRPGDRDQVGDPLHALAQDVVGLAEGVEHRRAPLDDRQQLLVGDHDQRVDDLAQTARCPRSPAARAGCPRSRTAA